MNKWLFISIFTLFCCLAGYLFFQRINSVPTVIYFPIDQKTTFDTTDTRIEFITEHKHNQYELAWTSNSKSSKEVYLRQDTSLLFDNGLLRGVTSKWSENSDTINLQKNLLSEDSSYFQAISYHHGEIHYPDDQIKSIQKMSYDELYVVDSPTTPLVTFQSPKEAFDREWKKLLDVTSKQQLLYHWKKLMRHFNIQAESYDIVPLTSLHRYNQESLANMTQKQTDQMIGQLWEGLYKNYIIPASSGTGDLKSSYIPLVLFAKDRTHLIVLFQLHGEKQKLIQEF
ncbi:hypothetical protein [Lentibacillus sp. Marseille-P4043]|uniref:hypothetical protein n=1 Tax=Lentibacillus sp. Marseille-P4043 TaxID=2040293 RepID=UPI000D0B6CBB|nr:hypothetical protein [Lentibacillus sp. Marseille-P4043]